jgi:hypothetical protein
MATTNKRFVAKNGIDNNGNTITNVGASGNSLGLSGTGDLTVAISGTATLTVPATTDTLVTLASIQTLTNKTISGADNTLTNIANGSLTNSSITINGTSVSLGGTRTLVTDDIAEDGSPVNLWYTDTRARSSVSVTDAGGDGSLAYDSGTGVITYTGPSASEVRAHFSAGTGVTITSGQVAIGQAVATTDNVSFAGVTADNIRVGVTGTNEIDTSSGNLTIDSTGGTTVMDDDVNVTGNLQIDGNLTVSGTTVTVNATNLAVEDNMIYLNNGSAVANPDLGIAGNYNDGTYRHAGIFRDASDGVWKFFHEYTPEPDASAYIDITHGSFALAPIQASVGTLSSLSVVGVLSVDSGTLYVDATNNRVGIGITNPSAKLHVSGENIIIDRSSGDPFLEFYTSGTTNNVSVYGGASTGFRVFTGGSERIRIDGSGSLGLGVAPSAWVSTRKAFQTQGGAVFTGTDTATIGFIQNGFNDGTGWKYVNNGFASRYYQNSSQHIFDVAASGTAGNTITFTQAMTLDANARLGVNTGNTSLSYRFTAAGTQNNNDIVSYNTTTGGMAYLSINDSYAQVGTQGSYSLAFITSNLVRASINADGRMSIGSSSTITDVHLVNIQGSSATHNVGIILNKTNATAQIWGITNSGPLTVYNYTLSSEALRITAANNVGIGTTNPGARVEVYNSGSSVGSYLRINNAIGKNWELMAGISGVSNDGFGIYSVTDSAYRFVISSAGNVGINTTNPGNKLQIGSMGSSGYGGNDLAIGNGTQVMAFYVYSGGPSAWFTNTNFALMNSGAGSTGNVGIGTTTPNQKLHVRDGRLEVESAHGGYGQIWVVSSGAGNESSMTFFVNGYNHGASTPNTADAWVVGTDGDAGNNRFWIFDAGSAVRRFTIDPNGNVGIGNTNPPSLLSLQASNTTVYDATIDNGQDDSGVSLTVRNGDTSTVGSFSQLCMQVSGDSGRALGRIVTIRMGSATSDMAFVTENANTKAEKMRITAAGNVGIGTTSPSTALHIYSTTTSAFLLVEKSTTYAVRVGVDTSNVGYFGSLNATPVQMVTNGSARMYIDTSGNVGIGTTSPGVKLQVQSGPIRSAGITNGTYIELSGNLPGYGDGLYPVIKSAGTIHFANNEKYGGYIEGNDTYMGLLNSSLVTNVKFHTNGVSWLTGGNVGIGTTNPGSYKLQVQGDQYISGTLTEASSIALKENINPIVNALTIISNLRGYTYDRKDGTAKNQAGLIAEEVEQTLPNVVSYDSDGHASGVQYTKIIAYLVESIKELKKELDSLRK